MITTIQHRSKMTIVITLLFLASSFQSFGQPTKNGAYQISLPSRTFTPNFGIADSTKLVLQDLTKDNKNPYVLIQLKKSPTRFERDQLKAAGVQLVSIASGNTWYAKVKDSRVLDFKQSNDPKLKPIRWIGNLQKKDRMGKYLQKEGFAEWAKLPNNKVKLDVDFFKDVSRKDAKSILAKYNAEIKNEHRRRIAFNIVISEQDYLKMLNEEKFRLVENPPAPYSLENNGGRTWTNTNQVQLLGIDGEGVNVGVWDGNEIDDAHNDLAGRVTFGEVPRTMTTSEHATHVAGIIGGNGANNINNRGHAPAVQLFSYDYNGNTINEMIDAVDNNDINISSNSYGTTTGWFFSSAAGAWQFNNNQSTFGDYNTTSGDLDDIARTDNVVIVFSAGNDRNNPTTAGLTSAAQPADADQGSGNNGYATLNTPKSSKNIITVGAINDATTTMTTFSNWGPTDDGRIKPDVVAPGRSIVSTDDDGNNGSPGDINNAYTTKSGTSMAAPAVSGIAALLIQAYREEFFGTPTAAQTPLSSTIKSLIIHSAQDLGQPGPDFQNGWGGIDAEAAYNLIDNRLFLESEFRETGQEDVFFCEVPTGAAEFKATLGWSDVEAIANCNPCLINDLDIKLESPTGTMSTPWRLNPAAGSWANNATRNGGADHVNNVEQVSVLNPTPGLWKIHVTAFAVNDPVADPQQKYSLVSDFPFIQNQSVSVIQVIDRTGSMGTTFMASAKQAAQNFIGLMKLGDQAGVVAFDDPDCNDTGAKAEPIFDIRTLNMETDRDAAINSINPITSRGCTSIGGGMELAQTGANFLSGAEADNPHAMVILTDGFENTTPWVENRPAIYSHKPAAPNNVLSSIPDKTQIFTVALGTTADTDLMEKIANESRGKFYESPTTAALLSIYYQIRSNVDESEMSELDEGIATGERKHKKVIVDKDASEVSFALGWLSPNEELDFVIKDPNGLRVTSQYPGANIIQKSGFNIVRISQPKSGEWDARISKFQNNNSGVDYTFASFISGRNLLTDLLPTFTRAGDCLLGKVQLQDPFGQPITGANISVNVQSPRVNKYTQHYNLINSQLFNAKNSGKLDNTQAFSDGVILTSRGSQVTNSDPLSAWANTLQVANAKSIQNSGRSIFQKNKTKIRYYDDGTHGDEKANDGIYSYCFPKTEIAGNYHLKFSIQDSKSEFSRKFIATQSIVPAEVDPRKSIVRIIDNNGTPNLIIVPMDKYGNLIGPRAGGMIGVFPDKGQVVGGIVDRGDGIYVQVLDKVASKGKVNVIFNGVELEAKSKRFGVSIHGGTTFPLGTMENNFSSDLLTEIDLEYRLSRYFSLEAILGRYQFKSDFQIDGASLSLKGYLPLASRVSLYGALGGGGYQANNQNTNFGLVAGGGISFKLRPNLYVDGGVQYHQIFDTPKIEFWGSKLGFHFFIF